MSDTFKGHNPAPPPGYRQQEQPECVIRCKPNVIDGVPCLYAHLILDSGIFDSDNDSTHSDLELSDDDDDDEIEEVTIVDEVLNIEAVAVCESTEAGGLSESEKQSATSSICDDRESLKRRIFIDYNSDDSCSPSVSSKCKSKRSVPPAESKGKTSEYLYGYYPCEVCNITLTSLTTFKTHMSGKKHQKAVKAKDDAALDIQPTDPVEVSTKYPKPPKGVIRKSIKAVSYIQEKVERCVTNACPGLQHVIEIRGLKETSYYCTLCDSPCSVNCIISHLRGFKHSIQCLKLYKPDLHAKLADEPKYKVQREISRALNAIQRSEGRGYIVVQIDVLDETYSEIDEKGSVSGRSVDAPSCSFEGSVADSAFSEYYASTTIPDMSKSDFYCKICESHMNSPEMWESHIRGKRHLTNIKKNPGARPSKMKLIPMQHIRPVLLDRLKEVRRPVVGLSHIREVQNMDTKNEMYNCYLCGGCLTSINIIEHILSQKHRTKYLEHIRHRDVEMLKNINLKDHSLFNIIEEICANVENEYGSGHIEVFVSKGVCY